MSQSQVLTNLQVLSRSRKVIHVGDVFVWKVYDDRFGFGRVIRAKETLLKWPGTYLIYIYNLFEKNIHTIPALTTSDLLLPPIVINRLPWSKGYFETVANSQLETSDVLPVHCFKVKRFGKEYFVDEQYQKLSQKHEPCGYAGLSSFRVVDDMISQALGIPLVVDDTP